MSTIRRRETALARNGPVTAWERFELLLRTVGMSRHDLCRDGGLSQQMLTNWKRRGAIGGPGAKILRQRTGVSVEWLNDGVGPMFVLDPEQPDLLQLIAGYQRLSPRHREIVLSLVSQLVDIEQAPPQPASGQELVS